MPRGLHGPQQGDGPMVVRDLFDEHCRDNFSRQFVCEDVASLTSAPTKYKLTRARLVPACKTRKTSRFSHHWMGICVVGARGVFYLALG